MYRRLLIAILTCAIFSAPGLADEGCLAEQLIQAPDTDPQEPGEHVPEVLDFLTNLENMAADPPDPDADPPHELCVPGTGGPIKINQTSTDSFSWPSLDPDNGIFGFGGTEDEEGATEIPEGTSFHQLYASAEHVASLRDQLTHDQLMTLLSLWPAPPSPFDEILEYDIRIVNIDISNFPEVEIRFKVFQYDVAPPSFANEANSMGPTILIEERIPEGLGDAQDGGSVSDFQEVSTYADPRFEAQCVEDVPVVMGIALDTSGSMSEYVQSVVLPNSQAYVNWIMDFNDGEQIDTDLDPPRESENAISFFAFSGSADSDWPRAPGDGHDGPAQSGNFSNRGDRDAFQAEYDEMADEVGSGSSPIFAAMLEELDRLQAHGDDCEPSKMLVTMSDFFDYPYSDDREAALIQGATEKQIFMANLLIGDPEFIDNPPDDYKGGRPVANKLAEDGRGVVVQNAFENSRKAFFDLHMGAARSYCVRYTSRFPDRWNDRVEVRLVLPGPASGNRWAESFAGAQYPLPVVVPEDTPLVSVFIPVPEYFYGRYGELGMNLDIDGKLHLVNARDQAPRRPVVPNEPLELEFLPHPIGPFSAPDSDLGTSGLIVGFANAPNTSLTPDSLAEFQRVFQAPTSPIPEEFTPGVNPVTEGTHFIARFEVSNNGVPGTCVETVEAIMAVQDRTPPAVFVRLRPSQGQEPSEIRIYENGRNSADEDGDNGTVDADPWPLADDGDPLNDYDQDDGAFENDRITYEGTNLRGHGQKRALIRTEWIGAGEEVFTQRFWTEPLDPAEEPDLDVIPDPAASNVDLVPFEPEDGGILVPADVRVEVIVRARDNYAGLNRLTDSYLAGDGDLVWMNPAGEEDTDPPLHAKFDANSPEFQMQDHENSSSPRPELVEDYPGQNTAPPYLPVLTRTDMLDEPNRAGVCWWIESVARPDRFAGGVSESERIDNVGFFQYGQSDEQEENEDLDVQEAVLGGANSLRQLHVWARDEHGNSTRFEIPIRIMESDFKATAILNEGGRR
jgi:hypothetical protein